MHYTSKHCVIRAGDRPREIMIIKKKTHTTYHTIPVLHNIVTDHHLKNGTVKCVIEEPQSSVSVYFTDTEKYVTVTSKEKVTTIMEVGCCRWPSLQFTLSLISTESVWVPRHFNELSNVQCFNMLQDGNSSKVSTTQPISCADN